MDRSHANGYAFVFFRCDGTADPAVSVYEEGDEMFRPAAPSFTAWLARTIEDERPYPCRNTRHLAEPHAVIY